MLRLRSSAWPRQALALLRLTLLYGILCGLLLAGGLLLRSLQAAGQLLPDMADKTVGTGLPFAGVNVDPQVASGPQSGRQRRETLAALRRGGFGWVRLRFDWADLEPQPGAYAWTTTDAWIDDAVREGLAPLVVLDGSPRWARAEQDRTPVDNPLAPPADPHDMARFAAAFASRYADKVRYYQVWDEPNIAPHWGSRWIEPVAYAQLLKTVAPAMRAGRPRCGYRCGGAGAYCRPWAHRHGRGVLLAADGRGGGGRRL